MTIIHALLFFAFISCVNSGFIRSTEYAGYSFVFWGGGYDDVSWCEAVAACIMQSPTAFLAVPKTEAISDMLFEFIKHGGTERVWIGANDLHSEDEWTWSDGTDLHGGYFKWESNQPDDARGEDCLETINGYWNDADCGRIRSYVCQSKLSETTKSDFVALAFSDSFPEGSKSAMSIAEARTECENRGLKLIRDIKSDTPKKYIKRRLHDFAEAKYCIDDENHGKMMSIEGMLDQECTDQPFLYICEGYRPHYIKISNKELIVAEAGNIDLECTVDGYPVPDVVWHKNHEYVISTDTDESIHQVMFHGSSTLLIKNAKLGDADLYRCVATNNINGEEYSVEFYANLEVTKNQN